MKSAQGGRPRAAVSVGGYPSPPGKQERIPHASYAELERTESPQGRARCWFRRVADSCSCQRSTCSWRHPALPRLWSAVCFRRPAAHQRASSSRISIRYGASAQPWSAAYRAALWAVRYV